MHSVVSLFILAVISLTAVLILDTRPSSRFNAHVPYAYFYILAFIAFILLTVP